jgi:tripartite-type tricarboxylate transporter receptor subunit TctC
MHNARAMLRGLMLAGLMAPVIASSIARVGHAQGDTARTYPTKPVSIVVGFGPGGGNDIYARLIQPKLAERLGKPVLVENKPGAGGTIAATLVAKSAPDGHTLYLGATGAMTISPVVLSKLPYDTLRDFSPISMIAWTPLVLAVNASAPVKTVQDLVAYAKANPIKANYGSSSPAFLLPSEQFKQRTGTPFAGVNYKSSSASLMAVISGEVLMAITDVPPAMEQLQAGRVRAIAVTGAQRLADLPDVPTMAEAGLPDLDFRLWSGVFAPAATPTAIVKRLEKEMIEIINLPEVKDRLKQLQVDPSGNTSEEFKRVIEAELTHWAAVAKAANIKLD